MNTPAVKPVITLRDPRGILKHAAAWSGSDKPKQEEAPRMLAVPRKHYDRLKAVMSKELKFLPHNSKEQNEWIETMAWFLANTFSYELSGKEGN